jgi:LmbE family N-acetylglucosaminyl deacetylase
MRRFFPLFAVFVATAWLLRAPIDAQVRPVYDFGADGLTQVLQRLQTTGSVLHTGAHPDDEDSAFLARAARGDHARVGYFALNRGEGGQNIIGPELFDALGVIRTEELLQARRLDGAQQFFGRTFDYGFSKTLVEAQAKWNERETLDDMVRIIRTFRPLVIYSRFSGTPADGHGHHQMAGRLTPLAFKAAGDPTQFPDQLKEGLRPWQARKLYRGLGFGANAAGATLEVQTGVLDPVVGRSYAEIAIEGRSQHKTQQQGGIEIHGPATSGLMLLENLIAPPTREQSVFDGIDITMPGLAKLAGLPDGALRSELQAMDAAARRALDEYEALKPSALVPVLAAGLNATRAARAAAKTAGGTTDARADADFLLAFKEQDFADALARAAGVIVDPLSDVETMIPGGSIVVSVRTFVPPQWAPVDIGAATVTAPAGWRIEPAPAAAPPQGQGGRREVPTQDTRYRVTVAANAPVTQPYHLEQPRQGDAYRWSDTAPKGLPFTPPPLTATVKLTIGGATIDVSRPVEYRVADGARGELRREFNVVPAVAVGLDSPLLIVPLGTTAHQQRLVVRATNFSPQPIAGTLRLRLPAGWTATPAEAPFTLTMKGETTSTPFIVTAPARRSAGTFEVVAEAVIGSTTYSRDIEEIAYPHIQTHRLYWPATSKAQVLDLKLTQTKVGYLMGSGDEVPDALRRMGFDVTMIDDEMMSTGDLSRFDTIVVGIRASEARPSFAANNGRLRQFMERGGALIVQYQQADYTGRGLAPYPAVAAPNSRVTDENAPVKILAPAHPVFTFPNRITEADFEGWVQERNLWAFVTFDPQYVPLLETADPGEPPQRGGEVYADVGKGRYVYTAYDWFRELPAGVPGAYRQFANLVSLAKAPR